MYRTMLLPLDGSPASEQAVPVAARLARAAGATLHLVHVHAPSAHPISIEGLPVIDEDLHSLAALHEQTYLDRWCERLSAEGVHAVASRLEGPIAAALIHYAHQVHANLIIMTTRGVSGFTRLILGSVADALVRDTHIPLLLLRPPHTMETIPLEPFRKILLPLDGSPLAEWIVRRAQALGALDGAEFVLAHITDAENAAERESATHYLEQVADRIRAAGQVARTEVIYGQMPAETICAFAREEGASLIALATHGHSGLAEKLLGSVTDRVLHGTDLPVLVMRPE